MTISLSYFYFGRHHVGQWTPRATEECQGTDWLSTPMLVAAVSQTFKSCVRIPSCSCLCSVKAGARVRAASAACQHRACSMRFGHLGGRGAQIPGARSPERINFVRWLQIFACSVYGTCFISPFYPLEC